MRLRVIYAILLCCCTSVVAPAFGADNPPRQRVATNLEWELTSLDFIALKDDNRTDQYLDGARRADPVHLGVNASYTGVLPSLCRRYSGMLVFLNIRDAVLSNQRFDKDARIPIQLRCLPEGADSIRRPHWAIDVNYNTNQYWVNQQVFATLAREAYLCKIDPSMPITFADAARMPRVAVAAEYGSFVGEQMGDARPDNILRLHGFLKAPRWGLSRDHGCYFAVGLDAWYLLDQDQSADQTRFGYASASFNIPVPKGKAITIEYSGGSKADGGFQHAPLKWTFSLTSRPR